MRDCHLFLLVHGLFGTAEDMQSLAEQLHEFDDIAILCAAGNSGSMTFDGVRQCADRLFVELFDKLMALTDEGYTVSKLSVVGYSFGGLVSRYLIGILYEHGFFASVQPMVFATFATPHAGVYLPSWRPKTLAKNFFGRYFIGHTGHELFSINTVLADLADPKQKYFRALQQFQKLFLFANATNDLTVPFWTSYLAAKNPFSQMEHIDLVFYDQNLQSADGTQLPRPCLVAMDQSRYRSVPKPREPAPASHRRATYKFYAMLPVFVPVVFGAFVLATVLSYTKSHDGQRTVVNHQEIVSIWAAKCSLELQDKQVSVETQVSIETTPQTLIESAPELAVAPQTREIIDNLNRLPWNKYTVLVENLNSHGEIVDRHKQNRQGRSLLKFFCRTALLQPQESSKQAQRQAGA